MDCREVAMRVVFCLLVCFSALAFPASRGLAESSEVIDRHFREFIEKYRKAYSSDEMKKRRAIPNKNLPTEDG